MLLRTCLAGRSVPCYAIVPPLPPNHPFPGSSPASFLRDLTCIRLIYTLSFSASSFPPPMHVGAIPDINSALHERTTTAHAVYIVAPFISFPAPWFHPPIFIPSHQHKFLFHPPQTYSNIFSLSSRRLSVILYLTPISHVHTPKHTIHPVYRLYPVLMCTFTSMERWGHYCHLSGS